MNFGSQPLSDLSAKPFKSGRFSIKIAVSTSSSLVINAPSGDFTARDRASSSPRLPVSTKPGHSTLHDIPSLAYARDTDFARLDSPVSYNFV